MIPNKKLMKEPFALCCFAGVRFSTLLANHITYSGYSKADIASMANTTERKIKAYVQGDRTPCPEIRRAFNTCLGFDPWAVASEVSRSSCNAKPEELVLMRGISNEKYSSLSEEAAPYIATRNSNEI